MKMFILPWDDDLLEAQANLTEYIFDRSNYGEILFKPKQDPGNAWTMPFVTGHKYKIHWADTGLDFEEMRIEISERWEATDKPILLSHNYTDVRELMNVNVGG
jgi:hypothetical protein